MMQLIFFSMDIHTYSKLFYLQFQVYTQVEHFKLYVDRLTKFNNK
jgi:hypothetical protein